LFFFFLLFITESSGFVFLLCDRNWVSAKAPLLSLLFSFPELPSVLNTARCNSFWDGSWILSYRCEKWSLADSAFSPRGTLSSEVARSHSSCAGPSLEKREKPHFFFFWEVTEDDFFLLQVGVSYPSFSFSSSEMDLFSQARENLLLGRDGFPPAQIVLFPLFFFP